MEILLLVINFILFFTSVFILAAKTLHIFQLNSYKIKVQLKWMKNNIKKYVINIVLVLFGLSKFLIDKKELDVNNIYLIISIIFFAIITLLSILIKKQAKKPLVYTGRVKRILFSFSILLILIMCTTLIIGSSYKMPIEDTNLNIIALWFSLFLIIPKLIIPVILITLGLSPVLVLVANIINLPFENTIKLYYINDAKKILSSMPNLIKIGITGSFGKTSMKFYLCTLLEIKYNTLATPESFNTPMGIVRTVREKLKPTDEIFIAEMGARNVGDIKELCNIVHPKYGIITSIGHQHLESFKTIENIIKTKLELADSVNYNGLVFVNGDDDLILANIKNKQFTTYGLKEHNDFVAHNINIDKNGTTFQVKIKNSNEGDGITFTTSLIGNHNVLNIIGAISIAHHIGIPLKDLKPQVKKIPQVPHRMQIIPSGAYTIIDDSYNSNPKGAKEALNTLSLFDNYKILITPGMVELGSKENKLNYEFGVNASKVCDYIVLVGERQTKYIHEGIMSSSDFKNIYIASSFMEAMEHIKTIKSDKEKIILLENDLPDNY